MACTTAAPGPRSRCTGAARAHFGYGPQVDETPPPVEDPPSITVTYDARPAEGARTAEATDVRTQPGTMGDPLRAVANLPGVARAPLDTGWPLLRGGGPEDAGLFVDGVPVPMLWHLGGFASVVAPPWVDGVAVYPGTPPLRFGRLGSGAVDVTTKVPDERSLGGWLNPVFGGVAGAWSGPRLQLGASVRRSWLDGVMQVVPGVEPSLADSVPRFGDVDLLVAGGGTKATALLLSDTLAVSDTLANPVDLRVRAGRFAFEHTWATDGGSVLRTRAWFGADHLDVDAPSAALAEDLGGTRGGVLVEGEHAPEGGRAGWSAGVDVRGDHVDLLVNDVGRGGAGWSPAGWFALGLGDTSTAWLGLRVDDLFIPGQLPRAALSPRARWSTSRARALGLALDLGRTAKAPALELLVGPPDGAALGMETAWTGSVGAWGRVGSFGGEAHVWLRRMSDLANYEVDGSLGAEDGRAGGLDLAGHMRWPVNMRTDLRVELSRSERREDPGDAWRPSLYEQPVYVHLLHAWEPWRGWSFQGRWRWATGFPVPPVDDPVAYDAASGLSIPLVADARGHLPDFHALDLKISRHIYKLHSEWDLWLDVQNVYNRRVPEPVYVGYAELTGRYLYGYGLPVLPLFGVEGRWRQWPWKAS